MLFKDLDGTLTGLSNGGWVLPDSELVPPEFCTKSVPAFSVNSSVINGTVCSSEINLLRLAWNGAEPLVSAYLWICEELILSLYLYPGNSEWCGCECNE